MSELIKKRVRYSVNNGVASIELARPKKYNGVDLPLVEGLVRAAERVQKSRDIRAVVLSGEGKAFCAGLDFATVSKQPTFIPKIFLKTPVSSYNLIQKVAYIWRELPVPVIAVVHGYCFGAGLQIAMGADIRFSAPDTEFAILESKWGLIPDMSGMVTFRECVRTDVLKMLTMTGRRFGADEAAQYGFVTAVSDDPHAAADDLIAEIVTRSPDAVAASKDVLQLTRSMNADDALAAERKIQSKLLGRKNQVIAVRNGLSKKGGKPFGKRSYKMST